MARTVCDDAELDGVAPLFDSGCSMSLFPPLGVVVFPTQPTKEKLRQNAMNINVSKRIAGHTQKAHTYTSYLP